MKINTISAYLLVYLLARGHWNLMVPVRADDADGSSTAGGSAEGTALAGSAGGSGSSSGKPRSKAGSSAGSTASSTAGSDVANISEVTSVDPNGSDGSAAPETGSSGEGTLKPKVDVFINPADNFSEHPLYTGASLSGGSAVPAAKVELGSLFPEYGSSVVEYTEGSYNAAAEKEALVAKKVEAKQVAEDARKTAQQLLEAAEKIKKEADELTQAAEVATKIEDIVAKMDVTVYKVGVERSQASEFAKPPDMTFYNGFPDGHHRLIDHASLVRLYKLHWWDKSTMHYSGFPDGWHGARFGDADIIFKEAKKFRDEKYANDLEVKKQQIHAKEKEMEEKDKHIADKVDEIGRKKVEVDAKLADLNAKKREVNEMRDIITELTKKLRDLESEARSISGEYGGLASQYGRMEVEHRLLEDEKKKLQKEHAVLEEEEWSIVQAYYELSERTKHFEGKPTDSDDYVDPRENFTSFTEELGLVEAGEGASVVLGSLYPSDGGSTVEVAAKTPAAEVESGLAAPAAEVDVGESVHETLSEAADESSEPADAKLAEAKEESAEAAPANEEAAPAAKQAEGSQSVPAEVRLFKTDANGAEVEMVVETDFTKKHVSGDDRYDIKDGVKCTKVMYGTREVWKKGEHTVDEPTFVGFNDTVKAIVVRDNAKTAVFKKDDNSDNWKHIKTVERSKSSGTSSSASHTGSAAHSGTSASASEATPEPGSLSTPLAGSKLNLAEAEDSSSVTSEGSEGETGTGLRGATAE